VRLLADSIATAFDDVRGLVAEDSGATAGANGDASVARTARKVLGRAVGSAVDRATGLMPNPVSRIARAMNKRAGDAATDVVPALAQKAVGGAVARLSRLAGKSAAAAPKPASRTRAAARR